ncbi:MFS transporter [Entomohabitans teleogrylli]|uniref:MFS transporter n=1 Tax=Entomohabitans teleogrylli TaxID=1384589 RepID=UPI00073D4F63|nr:MFS transporter [Entomohabitans teleogrylli]
MHTNFRWLILTLVSSALFLIVVDMTVLYTALPQLTLALNASASQKLWIINAYPLVVAGLLPVCGMLSDRTGHKKMLLSGLALFGAASLGAACAPDAPWLIAARVALAVSAALMMPATLSVIRHVFRQPRERAMAIGVWAAVASGGAAIGPVVGGVLLEHFWWGAVFLINVPIVLLVWPLAATLIPTLAPQRQRHCDWAGALLVMPGLVGVVWALKSFSSPTTSLPLFAATLIGGSGLLLAFYRRQQRLSQPMIDFSLFGNALFRSGVAAALLAMVAMVGVELVLSQRLQLVAGFTPLQAALYLLPIPVASALAGPITGRLLGTLPERHILPGGFILTGLGIAGLAASWQCSALLTVSSLFVMGFGIGAVFTAASTAIMLNAPDHKSGMAASIEDVAYELGSVFGITLLGGMMSAIYSRSLSIPTFLNNRESILVQDSIDEALRVAGALNSDQAALLIQRASGAFDHAFSVVLISALILAFIGAVGLRRLLTRAEQPAK